MSYSEAVEGVGKLIAAFPNGSPANAKGYIGALAAVLADYPRVVAMKCVDPLRGVARETRFMPTVADLVGWCERERASLRQIVDREDYSATLAREAERRRREDATLESARKLRPTLQQMQEKHGPRWGLGEAVKEDLRVKEATTAQIASANLRTFERECAAAGVPATVSPALRELLRDQELMRDRVPAE